MRRAGSRSIVGMIGWLAITLLAALIGGAASTRAPEFYRALDVPAWAPPGAVFGPVWTVLYTLMALAAWLVWRAHGWGRARSALTLFVLQLAANALWSWLFFAWQLGMWAFVELVVLWALIFATLVAFWRLRRPAGALLVPYLAWVTFAGALNLVLWQRNPALLG